MSTALEKHETAILSHALAADIAELPSAAARAILAIELSTADQCELRRLSDLAKAGVLSPEEETDLENYRHAGRVIELFKSKARIALKRSTDAPDGA